MAEDATLQRHRRANPQGCVRCREQRRVVPAEWNLKPPGKAMMYLCEPHARYWAAQEGLDFQAGEPLHPKP